MPYKVTNATSVINLFLSPVLNVVIHIKIHIWSFKLKETPTKCNLCRKTFLRKKVNLLLVIWRVTHIKDLISVDSQCGKALSQNSNLINYMINHFGIVNRNFEHCKLKSHMATHWWKNISMQPLWKGFHRN